MPGGVLSPLEHLLCAFEVLGPTAGDERTGRAGVGAGEDRGAPRRSSISAAVSKWPSASS
jgi:hypothetical protein